MTEQDHESARESKVLPINVFQQLRALGIHRFYVSDEDRELLEEELTQLHGNLLELMESSGISVLNSSRRLRSQQRIIEKIHRRGNAPITDIFGVRLILNEEDIDRTINLIRDQYPTPEEFPWRFPSVRDYRDPEQKEKYNSNRVSQYTAVHINILFGRDRITKIAEIQLMTRKQLEVNEATRSAYEENQKKKLLELEA